MKPMMQASLSLSVKEGWFWYEDLMSHHSLSKDSVALINESTLEPSSLAGGERREGGSQSSMAAARRPDDEEGPLNPTLIHQQLYTDRHNYLETPSLGAAALGVDPHVQDPPALPSPEDSRTYELPLDQTLP